MTQLEFEYKLKREVSFDKLWNYGLCYFTILISLFLISYSAIEPEKFEGNTFIHYGAFLFLLSLGLFGLYKLPNRYKIIAISTHLPVAQKKTIIEKILSNIKKPYKNNENYFLARYSKNLWTPSYEIHFFYDEENICFSIQGQDGFNGGFIDFGGTEKLRSQIATRIQTLINNIEGTYDY